jgi:hypothetical protein
MKKVEKTTSSMEMQVRNNFNQKFLATLLSVDRPDEIALKHDITG